MYFRSSLLQIIKIVSIVSIISIIFSFDGYISIDYKFRSLYGSIIDKNKNQVNFFKTNYSDLFENNIKSLYSKNNILIGSQFNVVNMNYEFTRKI